ncbi:MAG: hypothetical protein ACYC63_11830 [Armatimonadota bacterium]
MYRLLVPACVLGLALTSCMGQNYLKVIEQRPLDSITETGTWTATGGPESSVKMVPDPENPDRRAVQLDITTDLQGPAGSKYPAGWPSCSYDIKPPQDWSGFNSVAFRIKVDSPVNRLFPIRFIIHTEGKGQLNRMLPALRPGKWVDVRIDLSKVPNPEKVNFAHFFICEDEYTDKLQMTFTIKDFRLEKTETLDAYLPPDECSVGAFLNADDRWTLLEAGTSALPCTLKIKTGNECALGDQNEVAWKWRNMFDGREVSGKLPLTAAIEAGKTGEAQISVPLASATPGYYLLTTDVLRDGKSLCGGRVGADDFYLKKPGESMAYTVMSYRLGMLNWLTDQLHGGLMTHGSIIFPHTYDPLNKETYPLWLKQWCTDSGKNTEGLEAGVTGLVFACEAFRRAGDTVRTAAAEKLLKNCLDYMISGMQDPDGGVKIVTNEMTANYGDVLGDMGGVSSSRDSNQVGEWVRPIARAVLYFRNVKGQEQYNQKLQKACFAAADFIVREGNDKVGEREHVQRHFKYPPYTPEQPTPIKRTLYYQEGRQCEVYTGRAMSGVSYVAYALNVCGQKVPDSWLTMLRETTAWAKERMEPKGGWFDWGCADVVEGGCHTFLGNQYIGEATMAEYMLEKRLGHENEAQVAAEATKLAYRYITDNCVIRGKKFGIPNEFWVAPYLYWEFAEYNNYIAKEPIFAEWMQGITDIYVKQNQWEDFTNPRQAKAGRAKDHGSLVTAILGWLGLHYMDEIGKPWTSYTETGK